MKTRPHNLLFAVLVTAFLDLFLFTRGYADVQSSIHKSYEVGPGGRLTLITDRGSVEVKSSKTEIVKIEVIRKVRTGSDEKADKILNNFVIDFEHSERDVTIRAEFKKRHLFFWDDARNHLKVRYLIQVPEKYNLDLKTSGGSIVVDKLEGRIYGRTSGGSLQFGDIKGPVRGETSGGSITMERCMGATEVRTSGGSIKIGEVDGALNARTSGGSIQIRYAKGRVNAETSGGNIRVTEVMGPIVATTSGGSVWAYLSRQPQSNCDLRTSGGNIEIDLPYGIAFDVDARTSGGRVVTDFPVTVRGELKKSALEGKINGGGPRLSLRTSGGHIKLHRRRQE
jgi:DUF4097 and DUF4098 domain-containing protein YvlB